MKEKLRQFMTGRYGNDQLNRFILVIALIFCVINLLSRQNIWMILALLSLGLCYFRMLSRNYTKRAEENKKYMGIQNKIKGFFQSNKRLQEQKKIYHIYKCPSCKQKIRVPKGKGKISVTCPKCHTQFEKNS